MTATAKAETTDQKHADGTNPCPHPESCPMGAKPAGYWCGCVIRVASPGPETADGQKAVQETPHCSFCFAHRQMMMGILAEKNRAGLVLAGAFAHGRH